MPHFVTDTDGKLVEIKADRKGTPEAWAKENPVLHLGQFGIETGTNPLRVKRGDGVTLYNDLPYIGTGGTGGGTGEPAQGVFRGAWEAGVQLLTNDLVSEAGAIYSALESYVTGATFAEDLAAGKLVLRVGGSSGFVTLKTVTTATYTILSTDAGKTVAVDRATAAVVTVPIGLPSGMQVPLLRIGAGAVTLAAATGVTWVPDDARDTLATVGAMAYLVHLGSNRWLRSGGLV